MQPNRYVNLNQATTYVQDPRGVTIGIRPFRESIDEHARKPDGIYVVEGEFWSRYSTGTKMGQLHPFPSPKGFGRESFPAIPVHFRDGRDGDGTLRTDGSKVGVGGEPVAATALPGRFRAAGDVLTPEGLIRRRNPDTGEDELVPDIPENRTVLKPLNEPGMGVGKLKQSIVDYLEEKGVETVEQFDALTDEQLLKIPGMDPLALKRVRENMRTLLQSIADKKAADAEAAGEDESDDDTEDSADDDSDGDESDEDDEDSDDDDSDGEEEDEEGADGRTVGTPAEAAKSQRRYTPPTAPARPSPKPKPKVKTKPKSKPAVVKKGGSGRHPNRRDAR